MTKTNLREFIKSVDIKTLTTPSHIKYGTAMHDRGAVEIISKDANSVEAWAGGLDGKVIEGGGSRRRVTLRLGKNGLHWHCSGNPKDHDILFLCQSLI